MEKKRKFFLHKINNQVLKLEFNDNVVYTINDVKQIKTERSVIIPGKHFLIVDIRNAPKSTNDARSYVASADIAEITRAMAFIVDGFLSQVIGNFYLRFNAGKYPTKLFNSEELALEWIKSFSSE